MLRVYSSVLAIVLPAMAVASDPECSIALNAHKALVTIKAIVSDAPGSSGAYKLQIYRTGNGNRSVTSQVGRYRLARGQSQVVPARMVLSVTGRSELVAQMRLSTNKGEFTCSARS